jgi:hypothetical protein
MKLALFKSTGGLISGYEPAFGQAMVDSCGYIRLSEDLEVNFPMLPPAVVVVGQLKQLDAAEQELRNQFQQKLNEIAEARAKLRSLSHDSQTSHVDSLDMSGGSLPAEPVRTAGSEQADES